MKKILLIAAAVALGGCHKREQKEITGTALPVEVATPTVRSVTLTREYPGYLEADVTVSIVGRAS